MFRSLCLLAALATACTTPTPGGTAKVASSATSSGSAPAPAASFAWRWDGDRLGAGTSTYRGPRRTSDGGIACTFTYDDPKGVARTACSESGHELWAHDEAQAFVADAALALDHGTLYSARISNIASGCTLHAFDARSGIERWSEHLEGIGFVVHSQYLNAVELHADGGVPVVHGWEAGGRYIEAVDPTTGKTTFHARLPLPTTPSAPATGACTALFGPCTTSDGKAGSCAEAMPTSGPATLRCIPK